jgi:hypothetical protein
MSEGGELTRGGRRRRYACADCVGGFADDDGPVIHDHLWFSIARENERLCLPCIERRLGRPLTESDLEDCQFNSGWREVERPCRGFAFGRQRLDRRT